MATTTTIPAVSAAIVAALTTALPGVQVTDGRPQDSLLNRESVWVGDITGRHEIPVMRSGRKPREETYEVDLWVWVVKPRGVLVDARQRAVVLWNALGDSLANDPRLGGVDGLQWATLGDFELRSDYAQEGPWAALRCTVAVAARLA